MLIITPRLFAQPNFPAKGRVFNDSGVPRIDITISPDSLNEIYNNVTSDHEYAADFMFTDANGSAVVNNVGFRLRGNTSRYSLKKSFKISFNSFSKGQKFYGLEKMNLNGEHNDPSIARSKLFWETAVKLRMPYSRSNHVELYINSAYYGLYMNVEHSDENFLQARFQNNSGNFYKCLYPANLNYLGTNPNNYKLAGSQPRVYDLQTNTSADDYSDLRDFIVALHAPNSSNYQVNLEKLFNVNAFLRAYAFDILTGNWDNYGGNQNNFYLYHNPETGKIDYITYDVDNTYGIDFLGKDWGTRNIYNWAMDTANRPLVTKLMAHQDYRNRFSYFMNKMIQTAAVSAVMIPYSNAIRNLISNSVFTDSYHSLDYGYSYNDFFDSFNTALGGHTPYGIQDFIVQRNSSALAQLQLNNVAPIFSETRRNPFVPYAGDSIFVKSWVEDESAISNVLLFYKVGSAGNLISLVMQDDGVHQDDAAGDGIFGAGIPGAAVGDTAFYYLQNTDANALTGREPRAGFFTVVVQTRPLLSINELMSKNISTLADNFSEFDDWFEIYNAGANADMNNIYVSDDYSNLGKWNVGNSVLPSNGYLLCWADENASQGANHASFKLSGSGERIAISQFNGANYRILDSLTFGSLADNQSIGCYPDGMKPIVNQLPPTPGSSNFGVYVHEIQNTDELSIYPNPVHDFLYIESKKPQGDLTLSLINSIGAELVLPKVKREKVSLPIKLNLQELLPGMYCLKINANNKIKSFTFVKQ